MATRYTAAPEVQVVARPLMAAHHPHLLHVRVEFLFVDKIPQRNGKQIWGTARKVTSLAAFLADESGEGEPFFCVVITRPIWEVLSTEQRAALVDHELCHCWVEEKEDGSSSLVLLSHDLEEFAQVVLRHGLWRDEVTQFHDVAVQAVQRSLYEDTEEAPTDRQSRVA